jgi:hypothetical protein
VIVYDVQQGSKEWHELRRRIPTASCFGKILTPKELRIGGAGSFSYLAQKFAETVSEEIIDWGDTDWTWRGKVLEKNVWPWYEFEYGVDVQHVGFVTTDDGTAGGSPDGLVGDDGGAEVKTPMMHTHVKYMLKPELLLGQYRLQVQGNLWVTGRKWWDLISYRLATARRRN